MPGIRHLSIEGYENVVEAIDVKSALHCFVAIHSTALGPALGGVRIYPYSDSSDALKDVLRLAKAMTYKAAMVQCGLGGGKSVIIADPHKDKTVDLLNAFAEVLNSLQGSYIAAEDVGSTTEDMLILGENSPYVAARPIVGSSGDPSRFTAHGVFCGMLAIATFLWGADSLRGKVVAIQGLGSVGGKLADLLFWEGSKLLLCDVDEEKVDYYCHLYGAEKIASKDFYCIECDILAPCALGGGITATAVAAMRCRAVGGAANNQLANDDMGTLMHRKGILYAPDYIINAGGLINAAAEFDKGGYNPVSSRDRVDQIIGILTNIFAQAKEEKEPTHLIADKIAEENIRRGIGKRTEQLHLDKAPSRTSASE